jgi:hypothetical protein
VTLTNLILLLLFAFIAVLFWQSRGIAEAAINHVKRYCEQQGLQMISVSRISRRLTLAGGKLGWLSVYNFEFSGNREDKYVGTITMVNKYAKSIDVPAYRIE